MPMPAVAQTDPSPDHHPAPGVFVWPIGALVAVHWVAHHAGPQPEAMAVIEAVNPRP